MERIDELNYKGLKIIQDTEGFCFGVDSVLLTEFARDIKENSKIVDLGSGTGILSILMSKKVKPKKIYGIEIQKEVAEMAQRSVKLNGLENIISIINMDLKDLYNNASKTYGNKDLHNNLSKIYDNKDIHNNASKTYEDKDLHNDASKTYENKNLHNNVAESYENSELDDLAKNTFDAIITNPPYKKLGTGINNKNQKQIISRYETTASLDEWLEISSKLLKDKGLFYIVYRTDRLTELIATMKKYKLEIKRMRFVYSNVNEQSNLVLIKAIKGAGVFLKVEKPLIIYNPDGTYTDEILKIYKNK